MTAKKGCKPAAENVGGPSADPEVEASRVTKPTSSKTLRRNTAALQGIQAALDKIDGHLVALTDAITAMTEEMRRSREVRLGSRKVVAEPVGSDDNSEMEVEHFVEE